MVDIFQNYLLFNSIFTMILFSVGIANSYVERTVYTQALLTITFDLQLDKNKVPLYYQEQHYNGKYGEDSPKAKANGQLYYAGEGEEWCGSMKTVPIIGKTQWIALIPRGNCTYESKINLAKKYNASAVIIFNNEPLEIPVIDDKVMDTVSVMISKEDGSRLKQLLIDDEKNKGFGVKCEIIVGTHYVDRRWKVSRTSVLFVLVSFILLMCISLAWLVFYYVQRFRHIYRNDRKEKKLLNAAKKAISKLKTASFQSGSKDEEDASCVVCLENYKIGETLRILPCRHEFHKSCIDPWLLNHRTCPMCKSNILKSLGVELPDNINLSESNLASGAIEPRHDVGVVVTDSSSTVEHLSNPSFQLTASTAPLHWPQQEPNIRYSSSSSNLSDTDNETMTLVSSTQKV